MSMLVSVCMIARNEERIISTAIASTKGLADEIIVLDTGSEDHTVEKAIDAGACVLTGGDRMDKGSARNECMIVADGDWVVILDCDERIADPRGLRSFLQQTDAQSVYIKLSYMDADDKPTLTYPQMRCWRRGAFWYKYRAHEIPVPVDEWGKIARTDFVWEHRPPPNRAWKSQYTLDRLLLDVEENPGDARPMYYLGRQYMYRSNWKLAIEWLEGYLGTSGDTDRADAWHCISKCHGGLGNKKEQIRALYRACAAMPERRDWWGSLAEIYHAQGQNQVAVGLLKYALEQLPPTGTYYTRHWFGSHIHDLLARCLWKLGRYEEGQKQAKKALELKPHSQRLKDNLVFFEEKS